MPEIKVLPKSVAELIAAGEVVERPASVVKELAENSIDAGAAGITVEIKNGGSRYIRVADNGCGIRRADVPTAFLPHATSKIASADDLNAIFTLGFRGEALPSIAAVSKVYLLTRTAEEPAGTAYEIEGGEEKSLAEAGCPVGTTVVVKDLFYNTPARVKFLKKDVTEGNYVADVLVRAALSHPEIRFTFIRDEKRVFSTPGGGDLYAAVYAVFGKEVAEQLLPCESEYGDIRVSGFVSRPLGNRPNRSMQYFFVNGRSVRIPAAAPALDRAYKNTIMVGKFPMCFLSLELPCARTDVNVHPTKTEIRFSDESKIFEAVFYAARTALSRGDSARPGVRLAEKRQPAAGEAQDARQLSFVEDGPAPAHGTEPGPAEPRPEHIPAPPGGPQPRPIPKTEPGAPPVFPAPKPAPPEETPSRAAGARPLGVQVLNAPDPPFTAGKPAPETPASGEAAPARDFQAEFSALSAAGKPPRPAEPVRVVGEVFKTYIIAERGSRMFIIDKHAAHERMIFNSLSREGTPDAQMLLTPAVVGLSGAEYAAVIENIEAFGRAGYEIEDFGGGSVIVRACPVLLAKEDITSLVREIAGKLLQGDPGPTPEKLDWIYNSTACRAAVKAGDALKPEEMQRFVETLLADENVKYCPHGRPVLYELTKAELEKRFGRTD